MVVPPVPAAAPAAERVLKLPAGPPEAAAGSAGVTMVAAGWATDTGASSASATSPFLLSTTVGFFFLGGTCSSSGCMSGQRQLLHDTHLGMM